MIEQPEHTDNTYLPGVLPSDEDVVRVGVNRVVNLLDGAMVWARAAVVPGEYVETLLSSWLWALDRAASELLAWEQVEADRGLLWVPFAEGQV